MPRWLVEHTHPQDPLPENQSWEMGPDMKLWSTDPSRGNTALDAGEMTKALTNHFVWVVSQSKKHSAKKINSNSQQRSKKQKKIIKQQILFKSANFLVSKGTGNKNHSPESTAAGRGGQWAGCACLGPSSHARCFLPRRSWNHSKNKVYIILKMRKPCHFHLLKKQLF